MGGVFEWDPSGWGAWAASYWWVLGIAAAGVLLVLVALVRSGHPHVRERRRRTTFVSSLPGHRPDELMPDQLAEALRARRRPASPPGHDAGLPAPDARSPAPDARPPAQDARPPAQDARPPAHDALPPTHDARPPGHDPRPSQADP